MIAWALSGGGNHGPIQVGAMRALFEANIVPQMLVGTSAGALNAAFLASDPTAAGVERLAQIWLNTKASDIFRDNRLVQALRFIFGANSLNRSEPVRDYIQKNIPPGISTFGDLKIKLYLTSGDLETGQLYLYGDDPSAKILDGALASTALPVAWSPLEFNGHQYVDGGVVANVPVSIAVDKGATTIYALDLSYAGELPLARGVYEIAMRTAGVLVYNQVQRDLQRAAQNPNVTLHHIYLGDIFRGLPLEDFTHTAEMIQLGYARAKKYLQQPTPNQLTTVGIAAAPVPPPGAALYKPPG